MSSSQIPFNRGVIAPVECLQQGWANIKEDYWTYLGVTFVGMLIAGLVPFGILLGPMMCGVYLCLLGRERGQRPSMEKLFKGFDFFLESFIAAMCMIVPMILIMAPLYIMLLVTMFSNMPQGRNQPPPNMAPVAAMYGLFYGVLFVVSLAFNVVFFFVFPLIADRRMKGLDAVKLSISAAFGNFGGILGLVLLSGLLNMLGLCGCCIGMYFVLPINFAAVAVAYRRVFPALSDDFSDDFDRPRDPSSTGIQGRRDQVQ